MILHDRKTIYIYLARLFLFSLGIFIVLLIGELSGIDTIMIVVIGILIVKDLMSIFYSMFKTVYQVDIVNDNLKLVSFFGKETNLSIIDINTIKVDGWLKLWSYYFVKIVSSKNKYAFYISPNEEKDNFHLFVNLIKRENPNCIIDEELLSA